MTMSGSKSRRDRMIIAVVVVVALYALAALLWFTGRGIAWKRAREGYESELKKLHNEKALIKEREKWEERAEKARQRMPHVNAEEGEAQTRSHWERFIENLAGEYHVGVVNSAQAQIPRNKNEDEDEDPNGVLEIPVKFDYENTSLQRLVEFLYAANTAKNAMLDVQELLINAKDKKNVGALKGTIVLTCAYLKDDESEEAAAPNAKTK